MRLLVVGRNYQYALNEKKIEKKIEFYSLVIGFYPHTLFDRTNT